MTTDEVEALFHFLVKGVMVEDVCGCIKERLLEYSECQHCGKVHAERTEELSTTDVEVECVDCGKRMAASRFSSHLEKCLSIPPTNNTSNNHSNSNSNNNNKKRKQK